MDQWLRNTNVVKVLALIIGILLWAVVHMEDSTLAGTGSNGVREEQISNVSVTPKYDSSQFYLETVEPAQVIVTITGKDAALKKAMNASNYSVELDLTNVSKGEHIVPLTAVGFPTNVTVKISPSSAKVIIDEKSNKQMPVTVNVTGIPAVGLKAGQPIVKPNKVTVTVPSANIEAVESVRADVNVEKAQSPVTNKARLIAYDKNGKAMEMVAINPAVVDVEVPITSPFTTVPLQLKLVGEPPRGYSVASLVQNTDKVTVYGPQDVLNRLEFYEGPSINLVDLKEEKEYSFNLDIPLRNKVTQLDPSKVEVKIIIVPSVTKTLEQIPLSIVGQNDGFDTKVVLPEGGKTSLTIEGASALVEKVKAADVQGILDVSNLPPGRHELPVSWNLPTFIKKAPQQDLKATVEISARPANAAKQ
ncbi:YbbR-like domain-containing protein [Paenibacillus radicis (ex Xue et al. 2023)]|uniref:CdaR family protein n=1 Tax=Paenibacillus radicis (ex Xue et al. 2023) TaxID=2972489 RepID=A0ABT1YUS5_9BACL|nr:CdaR family protein [Paenibacillus radicis (ex Xue et al. 2023)]MCR8636629.1 CdaR family protein [Paenibacillus radicis (ex Xue et al. 2023)]